jgi:hypothetical protein
MAAIHAANMAKLKREQVGTQILQYDDSKVMNHWRRNRKAAVDLLDLPVAVDRQLEDQRIQQEFNRNPRLHIPTRVDKVRSEQIIAKKGGSRDVGIKAKVVNKFVREATGIHTYALVPPPRLKGEVIPMDPDPETNPFVKTYAKETKKKPHIVSYGHRPSSASRTFNPGTMRIKMKHNEVATAPAEGKFEFGLPVGILAKLLHAPKIWQAKPDDAGVDVDAEESQASEAGSRGQSRGSKGSKSDYNQSAYNIHDPHDLFSSPPPSPSQPISDNRNNNVRSGDGVRVGARKETHHSAASIPPRAERSKGAMGGGVGDSFLGGSSIGVTYIADDADADASTEGPHAQLGFDSAQSWVSSMGGGGVAGGGNSEDEEKGIFRLFHGGVGNIDHLNFQIPGFPKGGAIEKPKRKKQSGSAQQLTPVRSNFLSHLIDLPCSALRACFFSSFVRIAPFVSSSCVTRHCMALHCFSCEAPYCAC